MYEISCVPNRADLLKMRADMQYSTKQYQQFMRLSQRMIEKGLINGDPRIRYAAMLAAGEKRLPLNKEFLSGLQDPDALVRQAARRSLVILSAVKMNPPKTDFKFVKANYVDFGPPPCCTKREADAARDLWEEWIAEREDQDRNTKPFSVLER